jgi:hypothetical protein
MYPLGTWFVSGMCVWIPCVKETMMMMIIIIIITSVDRNVIRKEAEKILKCKDLKI